MNLTRQDPPAAFGADTPALTVSALNRQARELLESGFPLQWIAGEISNMTRAPSGHMYFTLKDAHAQIRCTLWRNRAQLLPFRPDNGMQVEARALVTLYEARGDFQLNVETLRLAGSGDLFAAFNRLKQKLAGEGLFDTAVKRPLPPYPRGIGIITSPNAAALRDVLATLARRAPGLPVVLYPAGVQGADAPAQLLAALQHAGRRAEADGIDVLLLVRGGGSLEDLWAFNDEALARAIRACPLPVISGVGHEIDFTIADFVADLRAATPTAAAELVSAGYLAARARLELLAHQIRRAMDVRLQQLAQRLDHAGLRLLHPRQRILRNTETLSRLRQSLQQDLRQNLLRRRHQLDTLGLALHGLRPALEGRREALARQTLALQRAARQLLYRRHQLLRQFGLHLAHLSPQAVLARGYSITRDANGVILRDCSTVAMGAAIQVQLANGRVHAIVDTPPEPGGLSAPANSN